MYTRRSQGFALPTVIITSVVLFGVLVAVMSTVSSVRSTLNTQYNQAMARDAAESGVSYAEYCYSENSGTTDNSEWPKATSGAGLTLDSGDGCNGKPVTSYNCGTASEDSRCYVAKFGNTRTTFSVNKPDVSGIAFTFQATGQVNVTRSDGSASGLSWGSTLQYNGYTQVTGLAMGNDTACAIQQGKLYCWGNNTSGQVGIGTTSSVTTPTLVQGPLAGKYVYDVGTGIDHTCAVAGTTVSPGTTSRIYCWGDNSLYQYGIGNNTTSSTIPMLAASVSGYYPVQVSGRDQNCAIMVSNTNSAIRKAYCWGKNREYQAGETGSATASPTTTPLGDGGDATKPTPKKTPSAPVRIAASPYSDLSNVTALDVVNGDTSCGRDGNKAWCIGDNASGQMGDGNVSGDNIRVTYAIGMTNTTKIVTNFNKVCAINSLRLYCWGSNWSNPTITWRLDSGPNFATTGENGTPKQPITSASTAHYNQNITDVSISDYNGCFLKAGAVYCWGYNYFGQLGQGNASGPGAGAATSVSQLTSANVAKRVNGALAGKTVTKIVGGNEHFCAVTSDGGVYCWGWNAYGQLGDGTTQNKYTPVQVKLPPPTLF